MTQSPPVKPLSRFALIGDVHAEDELLAMALERLEHTERVDKILCVGDLVDGRGSVDRCVELLERHKVSTVRGNHDRWMLDDVGQIGALMSFAPRTREYLAGLPLTLRFETIAGTLCLCHAIGDDDITFVHDDDDGRSAWKKWRARGGCSIVVAGHSHQRGVWRFGRVNWINAGTLRAGDNPCFAVLDLGAKVVQWFDLDEDAKVIESEREVLPP